MAWTLAGSVESSNRKSTRYCLSREAKTIKQPLALEEDDISDPDPGPRSGIIIITKGWYAAVTL